MTDSNSQSQDRGKTTDDAGDLPIAQPTDEQAEQVRGGQVSARDFSFVQKSDKASPILM